MSLNPERQHDSDKTHYADPDTLATLARLERENAALRAELDGVRKDAAIFREALIHIGLHMHTDEQCAYMPLNEWIGHASVDDARKRDRELIDAAIAQGEK